MFSDVATVCNPLGSSKSKMKTNFFYFKLGNIKPEYRSKISDIRLVSLCYENDLKEFKPNLILEKMLDDIKIIENDRIEINFNNEKTIIKGSFLLLRGIILMPIF